MQVANSALRGQKTHMNAYLPTLRYRRNLGPEAEQLLAESALDLSKSFPHIWGGRVAAFVDAIDLVTLDRIGGEYGYGGSRVFIVALVGKDASGHIMLSVPLLAKIVEDNSSQSDKL